MPKVKDKVLQPDKQRIGTYLPVDMVKWVQKKAIETGDSTSSIIRAAVLKAMETK